MTHKKHSSDGAGYDPIMVELAHKVIAGGLEPEKFTAKIVVEDPANPDEKARETARRIRALGCNAQYTQKGKRTIVFYGSATKPAKGSGGKGRGGGK